MEQNLSSMVIKESMTGRNVTVLLAGAEAYSATSHKMMQGMLGAGLLSCCVYKYNGYPKIMYFTGDKRALSALGVQSGRQVLSISKSLVNVADQLFSADFLNLGNVVVRAERVYVDMETGECFFMMLPLNNGGMGQGRERFEAQIMNLLRGFVVSYSADGDPKLQELIALLSVASANLCQVKQFLASVETQSESACVKPGDSGALTGGRGIHLVGIGTPVAIDIAITKPEFIFGKNVNGVDGTISFNNAISRIHCKVTQSAGRFYVSDLNSSNGTYVNGVKLVGGKPVQVRPGDRIRMANSDFELREV